MAKSPAHKFGQFIGDLLEQTTAPLLQQFAQEHHLFLDKKGPRPARKGTKLRLSDAYGNTHDLDFVLEKGGSATHIGTPVAFIEIAWRSYTKHSRNKAQEIQGAILPLAAKHHSSSPFMGVVLAGVFTSGALEQLKSQGFSILFIPYDTVLEAFSRVRINARFDEQTSDAELEEKVRACEGLTQEQRTLVRDALVELNVDEIKRFMLALTNVVMRQIESIHVLPLYGTVSQWISLEDAVRFVENYDDHAGSASLIRYEVEIRYNNGNIITGKFGNKQDAIQFLLTYQSAPPPIVVQDTLL